MTRPSEPSTILIRSRKAGRTKRAMIMARNRKTAVAAKTPRIRVLSLPNSLPIESRVSSLRKVLAKAATGIARKLANCVSGCTAPSSEGSTYFGTSHRPTKALSRSAARLAQKSMSEYHQKSPSRVWSLVRIFTAIWRTG